MTPKKLLLFAVAFVVFLFFATNAYANVGLPMIFLGIPFLVLAFIPVFLIEAFIYNKILNLSWKKSAVVSFWANVLTTIVGYPISWFLHIAVGMVVGYPIAYVLYSKMHSPEWIAYALFPLTSAWLMPGVSQWTIFLAGLFCLIPAFWISLIIEGMLLRKFFKINEPVILKKAVWKANSTTYLLLASFLFTLFMFHGLIKLHAFDFLRDRSDEKTAFDSPLTGTIFVASNDKIYSLNLEGGTESKISAESFKEKIPDIRFENTALTKNALWFTSVDFTNGRKEKLYFFDQSDKTLNEIAAWKDVNKLSLIDNGILVFTGDSLFTEYSKKEGCIFKIRDKGRKIEKIFDDGFADSNASANISPSGKMLAELRLTESKDLKIFSHGPFFVKAELRLHDLETKENFKAADLWTVSRYKNTDNLQTTWHPDNGVLFFTNTVYQGGGSKFLDQLDLNELREKYKTNTKDFFIRYEDEGKLLNELESKIKSEIYQYNIQDKTSGKYLDGFKILSWSPDAKLALIEIGMNTFELLDTERGKTSAFKFDHLNKNKIPELTWSKDGKFIAYLGDSEHFLDKHHYTDSPPWMLRGYPHWIWIKELATGRERKFDVKPINPAQEIFWQ